MRRSASAFRYMFLASSLFLALASCKDSSPGLTGKCADLDAYTTTAAAPSFATAVFPILSNTTLGVGCGQATICHGNPSASINAQGTTLTFVGDAATVKSTLLTATPVNAPGMKFVSPNDVGSSFLAYKISKMDGLACVNAMCASGASLGATKPCGDPMPTLGMLSDAERTTILDWIAKGAAN